MDPNDDKQNQTGQPDAGAPVPSESLDQESSLIETFGKSRFWRENLRTRVLVGVPALLVVLALILLAPLLLLALAVAAVGVYGYFEYLKLLESGQDMRLPIAPLLVAAGIVGLGGLAGSAAALSGALFVASALVVYVLWFRMPATDGNDLLRVGSALAGLVLITWFTNHLSLLLQLPDGRGLTAFLVLVLTFNDTLAYLVGSLLGRTPLSPRTSPNKTVEGSLGGIAGGMGAGLLTWMVLGWGPEAFSLLSFLVFGAALAVFGQAGDLMESRMKRLNGADDSGVFLPGHGGLLDRQDAFLLASPLFYYLLTWLG